MTHSPYNSIIDSAEGSRSFFFDLLLGREASGWLCLGYKSANIEKAPMDQYWFEWPQQKPEMMQLIESKKYDRVHSYFCPTLFNSPKRSQENAKVSTNVWADLDTCHPSNCVPYPSITVQTSPNRWHAYWLLDENTAPDIAEGLARRIAYYHKAQGADTSGWDNTQFLRIPFTYNHKYDNHDELPIVTVGTASKTLYRVEEIEAQYPAVPALDKVEKLPMPEPKVLDENFLDQYPTLRDNEHFSSLYYNTPTDTDSWSEQLWALELLLFEHGLSEKEVFNIARNSACNKYARDGRAEGELWKEVLRAKTKRIEKVNLIPTPTATIPDLLTDEEIEIVRTRETFIERYIHWASTATDASTAYHQAGAFICLSGLLAGNLELKTSFGRVIPNLWFIILGNTTLTRKTTSMNLAMNLLYEINEDAMMATDGSIEGIFTSLSDRRRKPSILLRDEFTGLIEAVSKKDYMGGFFEQMTKLYDGDRIKRVLRSETIDIQDPIFLLFVGGIKDKFKVMLNEEMVNGGFIPRFVMICGEPNLDGLRDVGPPVEIRDEERESLINELKDISAHYVKTSEVTYQGKTVDVINNTMEVVLTPEAWKRYNLFERSMTKAAIDSNLPYLVPVMDRLSKSTLKAAILIAASVQRGDRVVVEELDLMHAIYYTRSWREHASEIVNSVGMTQDERVGQAMVSLCRQAGLLGVPRSELMKRYHLDAKRFMELTKTMEMRGEMVFNNGRYYVTN